MLIMLNNYNEGYLCTGKFAESLGNLRTPLTYRI